MSNEVVTIMLFSGMVLVCLTALIVGCCWDWYGGFWNRKLDNFERIQFATTSVAFGIVALGVLAWLVAFVGIIINTMYKIVL